MLKKISITDLERNLSDYIDRVEFNDEKFVVVRNEREVARLTPAHVERSAEEVMRPLFGALPTAAGKTWVADSQKMRRLTACKSRGSPAKRSIKGSGC